MRAGGLVEADVRDDSVAKESGDAEARAIEELVGDEEIERRQVVAERADCADRDDSLDAQELHCENIGAKIDFAGREAMSASVAREEHHAAAFQRSGDECVRG